MAPRIPASSTRAGSEFGKRVPEENSRIRYPGSERCHHLHASGAFPARYKPADVATRSSILKALIAMRKLSKVDPPFRGSVNSHPATPASPPSSVPGGSAAADLCAESDRKSTRLNSSHLGISYAVFCLKKKI